MLEIFLLFNCFVMGVIVMVGYQHWREHRLQVAAQAAAAEAAAQPVETPHPHRPAMTDIIPRALKRQAVELTKEHYQAVLDKSAEALQHDLDSTGAMMNRQVKHLITAVMDQELKLYQKDLTKLREDAVRAMGGIEQTIEKQRVEMSAALEVEMKAERERLTAQLETKLGDAVSAFLLETLQHNVDLGAQTTYLLDTLEEHKAELQQEVQREA